MRIVKLVESNKSMHKRIRIELSGSFIKHKVHVKIFVDDDDVN